MRPLIAGLLAFVVLVVAHLIIWRLRRPSGQYFGLLGLTGAVAAASLVVFCAVPFAGQDSLLRTTDESLAFALFFLAVALSYIAMYSCVQADSPSFSILLLVEAVGERGLTKQELDERFTDEILVIPRIADLVTGGLVAQEGARYVIRAEGALLARTHLLYRKLLRLDKGG